MKKYFFYLLVLVLPVMLLLGCNGGRPSLEDRIGSVVDVETSSHEGIIEPLEEINVYEQGTHQLDTGRKIILLQSPTIDLSRYLDDEVRVDGFMEKGVGSARDVFTVTEVTYLDESTQETNGYENKSYGFKFEHPDTWLLSETGGGLALDFEENTLVTIEVNSDATDLDGFIGDRENDDSTEVTIGAQRAFRFLDGNQMTFYVPNPPKEKVYVIQYEPSINEVDDRDGAIDQLNMFYDLLESFELIYLTRLTGDKCGGLQKLECPEDFICQLDSGGKYAEGVCIPLDSTGTTASCPFIAKPSSCDDYRISEYSQNGCPTRYVCVGDSSEEGPSFRDLNVVDAGKKPEDFDAQDGAIDESEPEDEVGEAEEEPEEVDYEIPEAGDVSREYVNDRQSFTVLYPKNWYYASFGAVGNTIWTVGFADGSLEEEDEALITLMIDDDEPFKSSAGRYATAKEIDDGKHLIIEGPNALEEVIDAMLDSFESF